MARGRGVEVEGAKELRKAIRQAQDKGLKDELKKANKDAAEIVADDARSKVPVRSGALRRSIRSLGSQTAGQVAAGRGKTRVYAPIIHFGNPRRGIRPNPFLYDAVDARRDEVRREYQKALNKLTSKLGSR